MSPAHTGHTDQVLEGLLRRCARGEHSAFRTLMETYHQYAYALSFKLLRDEESAKEIVQEAFVRVWNHIDRYRSEVKFTTWLYKIVVNLCYDRMKMEARRNTLFGRILAQVAPGEIPGDDDPHADLETRDLCELVLAAARRLPPMERLVFHLRDVQDLSVEETAELIGISSASVKTNLCYARRRLREAVADPREEDPR